MDELRAALIEALADKEHASWARWMDYLFNVSVANADGSVTILAPQVTRWRRQVETPYADLSEREKQSDRDEVAHILPIIDAYALAASATAAPDAAGHLCNHVGCSCESPHLCAIPGCDGSDAETLPDEPGSVRYAPAPDAAGEREGHLPDCFVTASTQPGPLLPTGYYLPGTMWVCGPGCPAANASAPPAPGGEAERRVIAAIGRELARLHRATGPVCSGFDVCEHPQCQASCDAHLSTGDMLAWLGLPAEGCWGHELDYDLPADARPVEAGEPAGDGEDPEPDNCDFEGCPGEVVAWTDRDRWCYAHALGMSGGRGE